MEAINQTVKFKLFVLATPKSFVEEGESPWTVTVQTYDSSEFSHNDDILMEVIEKEMVVDSEYDLRGIQVKQLEEEKAKMLAEHHIAVIKLDDKINSLLAIEHSA